MNDEQIAMRIVSDARYNEEIYDDMFPEKLYAAIVQALRDARKAPRGSIIDDQGVVRKLLGTFVLTDEGCVVGNGAKVYLMSDNWRDGKYVYQVTAFVDMGEPDDHKCFEDPTNAAAYLKQRIDAAEKAKEAK